jgi:hypothetical protein
MDATSLKKTWSTAPTTTHQTKLGGHIRSCLLVWTSPKQESAEQGLDLLVSHVTYYDSVAGLDSLAVLSLIGPPLSLSTYQKHRYFPTVVSNECKPENHGSIRHCLATTRWWDGTTPCV